MRIAFSEEEKAAFLDRRGFQIVRLVCEREEHIHGSRFQTVVYHEVVAVKGDLKLNIDVAFSNELHKALLQL